MSEATEAQLQEIYNDAGRAGAQAFRFAVKRAGHTITDKDAKAFVGKQAVGCTADDRPCLVMGEFQAADLICVSS